MGWKCLVPNCKNSQCTKQVSSFKVPNEQNLREKWIEAITPKVGCLRKNDRICEKHFKDSLIIKTYMKFDKCGKVIAKEPLKCARLQPWAVPTIFNDGSSCRSPQRVSEGSITAIDHSYALPICCSIPATEKCTNNTTKIPVSTIDCERSSNSKTDVIELKITPVNMNSNESACHDHHIVPFMDDQITSASVSSFIISNKYLHSYQLKESSNLSDRTVNMKTIVDKNCVFHDNDIGHVNMDFSDNVILLESEIANTATSQNVGSTSLRNNINSAISVPELSVAEISYASNDDMSVDYTCSDKTSGIMDSHKRLTTALSFEGLIFELDSQSEDENSGNISINLPKPWNACKSNFGKEEILVLTYFIETENNNMQKHIVQKSVLIKKNREIIYEIYSTPVDISHTKLPRVLNNITVLPEILKKFKDMRICSGIIMKNRSDDFADLAIEYDSNWRHKQCSLLSINKERCDICKKYNKNLNQKVKRMENKKNVQRISKIANPLDRMKLIAMQKKLKLRTRQNLCLKKKLSLNILLCTFENETIHISRKSKNKEKICYSKEII